MGERGVVRVHFGRQKRAACHRVRRPTSRTRPCPRCHGRLVDSRQFSACAGRSTALSPVCRPPGRNPRRPLSRLPFSFCHAYIHPRSAVHRDVPHQRVGAASSRPGRPRLSDRRTAAAGRGYRIRAEPAARPRLPAASADRVPGRAVFIRQHLRQRARSPLDDRWCGARRDPVADGAVAAAAAAVCAGRDSRGGVRRTRRTAGLGHCHRPGRRRHVHRVGRTRWRRLHRRRGHRSRSADRRAGVAVAAADRSRCRSRMGWRDRLAVGRRRRRLLGERLPGWRSCAGWPGATASGVRRSCRRYRDRQDGHAEPHGHATALRLRPRSRHGHGRQRPGEPAVSVRAPGDRSGVREHSGAGAAAAGWSGLWRVPRRASRPDAELHVRRSGDRGQPGLGHRRLRCGPGVDRHPRVRLRGVQPRPSRCSHRRVVRSVCW